MEKTAVDCIIVGQGLAGSCLALQMMRNRQRLMVFDLPDENVCSVIAAGLFNPVTGQNLVKTWRADVLFPYLHRFYPEAEVMTGKKFFFPMPMYRPFLSVEEQNDWMARSSDPEYGPLIESVFAGPALAGVRDPFGGLLLRQCGYVDTVAFMDAVRTVLLEAGAFRPERFDPDALTIIGEGYQYGDVHSARIVFCEGTKISENPWFRHLPVRPLKGETVRIKSEFARDVIVNRGVYMVPAKVRGEWKVGATYNPRDTGRNGTEQAREELLRKLYAIADFTFREGLQEWGFRPVTPDRRPILGQHPDHPGMFVFNGLGTKGVSLAPYFSEVLSRGMNEGFRLDKEVDLSRF